MAGCSDVSEDKSERKPSMLSDQEDRYYISVYGASEKDEKEFEVVYQDNIMKIAGLFSLTNPSDEDIRELNIPDKPTYIVYDTKSEVFRTHDVSRLNEFLVSRPEVRSNEDRTIEAAWEFLKTKGWDYTSSGEWKNAKVRQTIADKSYELIDDRYVGKLILTVTFEEQGNVVVGTPVVLVDFDTNEVIGYIPGE